MTTAIQRFNRYFADREMLRTAISSGVVVLARVGGTLATFGYTLLMARTMAPPDIGIVWTIWSATFIIATFATLNIGAGAVREVVHARARGEDDLVAGFLLVARRTLIFSSLPAMALFVATFALADPEVLAQQTALVLFAALAVPVMGWTYSNAAIATALQKGVLSQLPRTLVRPLILLLTFVVVALLDQRPGIGFAIGLLFVATLLSATIQFTILRAAFRSLRYSTPRIEPWRDWLVTGLVLIPSRIIGENLKNVFILAGSFGLANADTARFAIAFSLVSLLNFAIAAVEIPFNPKISAAIAQQKLWHRDRLLLVSGLLKLAPITAASALLIVFAPQALAIFGSSYVDAANVVRWLVLMPLARAALGPSAVLLQIAGRRGEVAALSILGLLALFAAIPIAGSYGVEAAAAAGSLAYVLMQLLMWLVCRVRTGIDGSSIVLAFRLALRKLWRSRAV